MSDEQQMLLELIDLEGDIREAESVLRMLQDSHMCAQSERVRIGLEEEIQVAEDELVKLHDEHEELEARLGDCGQG